MHSTTRIYRTLRQQQLLYYHYCYYYLPPLLLYYIVTTLYIYTIQHHIHYLQHYHFTTLPLAPTPPHHYQSKGHYIQLPPQHSPIPLLLLLLLCHCHWSLPKIIVWTIQTRLLSSKKMAPKSYPELKHSAAPFFSNPRTVWRKLHISNFNRESLLYCRSSLSQFESSSSSVIAPVEEAALGLGSSWNITGVCTKPTTDA